MVLAVVLLIIAIAGIAGIPSLFDNPLSLFTVVLFAPVATFVAPIVAYLAYKRGFRREAIFCVASALLLLLGTASFFLYFGLNN